MPRAGNTRTVAASGAVTSCTATSICVTVLRIAILQVRVNGREVPPGSSAPLPHLSLVEAGRVRLLFAVNPGAVRRIVRRSRAITLEA